MYLSIGCSHWISPNGYSFPFLRSPSVVPHRLYLSHFSHLASSPCVPSTDRHQSIPPEPTISTISTILPDCEPLPWMHLLSGIFRRFSPRVIVPVDSTIAEPFVLRCLAKACQRQPQHVSMGLDPFLFATHGTIIAQQQQLLREHPLNDDDLKDTLIPILYHKCNLNALNAVMDRLDEQFYEHSEGESQWGFSVFWSSARGALRYNAGVCFTTCTL